MIKVLSLFSGIGVDSGVYERDLNCYVILCKLTELSYACEHLITDEVPAFCDKEE